MTRPAPITVGVAGVIWNDARQVLLIRRTKPPREGQWSLPGGRLEPGETLIAGLKREIREETALEVEVLGLAGVAEIVDDTALGGSGGHYVLIDYGVRAVSGVACAGDDAADATWFDVPALAEIPLWEETRRIIAESARLHMAMEI